MQSKKPRQSNDISLLEENGALIKDKTEIANIFKIYFIHIADAAAEINEEDVGTDCNSHPSIQSISTNLSSNIITNFDFELTNSKQVEKFLLQRNTRKSCGHDLIPPRLLKESTSVISEPLAKIMNCSISLGHYPTRWKMGQVASSFKKDDEFCKKKIQTCRVSFLPALNNPNQTTWAFLSRYLVRDFISAYRPNYSYETSLLRLTEVKKL